MIGSGAAEAVFRGSSPGLLFRRSSLTPRAGTLRERFNVRRSPRHVPLLIANLVACFSLVGKALAARMNECLA